MSADSLKWLHDNYPKRPALRVEEVAHVLGKKDTRGAIQRVRQRMTDGVYPNGRKVDGIWQLPVEDLAEIMEPTPTDQVPALPLPNPQTAPSQSGRRKGAVGPRIGFIRAAEFWSQVFHVMGYTEDALDLASQANMIRNDGNKARDIERSKEQAEQLRKGTVEPLAPSRPGPRLTEN